MKKIYLLITTLLIIVLFSTQNVYADAFGNQDKTKQVESNVTHVSTRGQNSFSLTSIINGKEETVADGKNGNKGNAGGKNTGKGKPASGGSGGSGSGTSAPAGPPCFVWYKYGHLNKFWQTANVSYSNNDYYVYLTYNGTNYAATKMLNEPPLTKGDIGTNMDLQNQADSIIAYIIAQNPKALNEFTPTGRCGLPKAKNEASLYFSSKPIQGDTEMEGTLSQAVAEGIVNVNLKETGDGSYTANLVFGSKNFDSPGIAPDSINNIVWVWTVRVPDKNDPLLKTTTLSPEASHPSELSFPFKSNGGTSNMNMNKFKERLGVAFWHLDTTGTFNGSAFTKKTKNVLFQEDTRDYLKAMLRSEPTVASQVNENPNIFSVAKFEKNKSLTSTYTIPANIRALNGKVLVNVSVIVDGNYSVETDLNGGITTFNFPLGYSSGTKTKQFSSCSALATQVTSLIWQDINKMTPQQQRDAQNLLNGTCEVEEWKDGAAIAKVDAVDGKLGAKLDGTASYPPKSRKITYKYNLETETIKCAIDPNTNKKIYPNCEDQLVYKNLTKETINTTPWKTYTIIGYYWIDKHRIKIDNSSKFEIDFEGKSYNSSNSVMFAKLNKGNTYACLGITTSAGKSYGAFNSILGVSGKTTYQKTDKNFGKNGKSPLEIVDSGTYQYCDAIITEEKDRRVIENWGN